MIAQISNHFIALSNWRRVVWLAMVQTFTGLAQKNALGFIMTLAEPLIAIAMIYAIRGLLKQNTPNYGSSLFLFYASGFLPYYMFVRLSSRARNSGGGRGRLPGQSALDAYIAATLVNAIIWIGMTVAIFLGMWWLSDIKEVSNIAISVVAPPMILLILLAMGIGMMNSAVTRYIPIWNTVYSLATRGLIFFSGVLHIVDLQPIWIRQYSIINPLSHAIEWVRLGIWERYPHNSLDKAYLIEWVVVCLFLGMVIDRASLRTRS
jgi:capsular polysaccharide transport system permease protein